MVVKLWESGGGAVDEDAMIAAKSGSYVGVLVLPPLGSLCSSAWGHVWI